MTHIGGGHQHFCAALADDTVKCWGRGDYGQIGDGSTAQRNTPVTVNVGGPVKKLMDGPGGQMSFAVLTDGTLKAWGWNNYGQLGDGTTSNRNSPITINVGGTVDDVCHGYYHACALLDDGTMKCWGRNYYGSIGDGTTSDRHTPTTSNVGGTVKAMACGGYHVCALLTTGVLKCWGYNSHGEIGDGSTSQRTALRTKLVALCVTRTHHCLCVRAARESRNGRKFAYRGELLSPTWQHCVRRRTAQADEECEPLCGRCALERAHRTWSSARAEASSFMYMLAVT